MNQNSSDNNKNLVETVVCHSEWYRTPFSTFLLANAQFNEYIGPDRGL